MDIHTIMRYILGGLYIVLAIGNFIYTWWRTRVKGPDFRVNKIWGITTHPKKAGKEIQCHFSAYYLRWNYGDIPAFFQYKIRVQVRVGEKIYANEMREKITLQPQTDGKKQLSLNLPQGSTDWTDGTVTFTCEYYDHKGESPYH
ncbi:MAG: hypothetical protein U9O98_10260 [Asgard group archaeon]|nr:hypothetical protein [Asgard group archaeon]